jgi:fimbrial chaperone protein
MRVHAWAALAAAFFFASEAFAGSFTVAPVRIELTVPRRAASIEVQNTGDRPAQIQVERFRWLADNGGDDGLEATEDVIATPPIFTLAPGQKQIVRVLLFGTPDPAREATYRIILQETALNDPPPNAVQALLRINMPMFVTPPGARADLVWSMQRDGERWFLVMENAGNAHAHINGARTAAGKEIAATGYLLPGERRRIAVEAPLDALAIRLRDQPERQFQVRAAP